MGRVTCRLAPCLLIDEVFGDDCQNELLLGSVHSRGGEWICMALATSSMGGEII